MTQIPQMFGKVREDNKPPRSTLSLDCFKNLPHSCSLTWLGCVCGHTPSVCVYMYVCVLMNAPQLLKKSVAYENNAKVTMTLDLK